MAIVWVGFLGLLAAALHLAWDLRLARWENLHLREHNERLLARIGYEYHLQQGTSAPPTDSAPIPIDIPHTPLFSFKPARSQRSRTPQR